MAKSVKQIVVPADVAKAIRDEYYPERAALIIELMSKERMSRRDAVTWSRRRMKKEGKWFE